MAGLLVSVRSAREARDAVSGGATVIDIKEPTLGPLGRASRQVWDEVRGEVPSSIPVSAALGELVDWTVSESWSGLSYRKIGLSRSEPDWESRWTEVRERNAGPPWIAVVYADWSEAGAPEPDAVLSAATRAIDCVGVLVDTWDKSKPGRLGLDWGPFVERVRLSGRIVALAGRLDLETIRRLKPLAPDLFAVRGAACVGGDRLAQIDPARVAELTQLVAG